MKTLSFLLSTFALAVVIVVIYSNSRLVTPPELPEVITPVEPYVQAEIDIDSSFWSFIPPNQDSIHGTREENNKVLWAHLENSSHGFSVDEMKYVKVVLAQELACNRDILLGINGKSVGVLHKNNNCNFISNVLYGESNNVFIFPVDSIEVIQNGQKKVIDLHDYRNDRGLVNLSFAVGQTDNFVTLIEVE